MLYQQRLLWMRSPADVDHQINDARKYIELKQDILDGARTESDIKDSQMVLGFAIQTYQKLLENRKELKQRLYHQNNYEDKKFA